MPLYYFHLRDDDTLIDPDGTELTDVIAARAHAGCVARELMNNSSGLLNDDWAHWSMVVQDAKGAELFSFPLADLQGV
jgi:Domain of unknown function (DUF6894)